MLRGVQNYEWLNELAKLNGVMYLVLSRSNGNDSAIIVVATVFYGHQASCFL